ncbi:MAG TPA: type II toxin-antitoxin system RelE/ParE family toxin [Caulobacteraceae bacterium]|nr:type II toxin-antitoxin system RelE/ParE family toxin [Caulobacteraceae bacterium]
MTAPRIVRSASARRDLDDIWDYLAREAGLEIADAVLARMFEAMYRAAERPLLHRQRPEYTGSPRQITVFRYAIFYEPLPEEDGIFVWRVVHGARDLPRHIQRPASPDEEENR